MKTILAVSLLAVGVGELNGLLDSLNAWVAFGIQVFALAATMGGAWRWLIGPGVRKVRSVLQWVGGQLELIGTLDERLESMEADLARGAEHFARLDSALEAFSSDEARAVRRSIQTGDPVEFTERGADRRVSDTAA